jgi:hypothetical protein
VSLRPRTSALLAFAIFAMMVAVPVGLFSSGTAAAATSASSLEVVHYDTSLTPVLASTQMLPSDQSLWVTLTLTPSDSSGLDAFDAAVTTPGSPEYRHFLTEDEFMTRFAPSITNVAAVQGYFTGFGGSHWGATPDRLGLSFRISVAGADAAFHTDLALLQGSTSAKYFTVDSPPSVPSSVAPLIEGVGGLTATPRQVTLNLERSSPAESPLVRGSSSFVLAEDGSQQMFGSDYAQLYDDSNLFPGGGQTGATFPTNEVVDTILWSGLNATENQNLPPWDPVAADAYYNATFPANWPLPTVGGVPVTVNGVTPPPVGPPSDTLGDDSGISDEAYLDVEMAGSMAPGATVINFYSPATVVLEGSNQVFDDGEAQALSAALSYNYDGKNLAAVSNSFGSSDANDTLWDAELQHAAADGVTVFVSTGDTGDAPTQDTGRPQGQFTEWPSTSTFESYGDVAVGATTTTATGTATTDIEFDANVGSIASQSIWWNPTAGPPEMAGSTGGISSVIPEPAWQSSSAAQSNIAAAAVVQEGVTGNVTTGLRAVPDIAMPGNNTVIGIELPGGDLEAEAGIGGTSVASPMAAGLFAELAAVDGHSFGYVTPEIYRIGSYYSANPGASNDPLQDVTLGANFVFSAEPGWDAGTGWGTINAPAFLVADANPAIANYGAGGSGGTSPATSDLLTIGLIAAILVLVIVAVIVLVVLPGRRRRATGPPPLVAYNPYAPGMGAPSGWTAPVQQPGTYPPPGSWAPPAAAPPPGQPMQAPPMAYYRPPTPPAAYAPTPTPPPVAYYPPAAPQTAYYPPPTPRPTAPLAAPPGPVVPAAAPPPAPAPPQYAPPAAQPQWFQCPRCQRPRPYGPGLCPTCGAP